MQRLPACALGKRLLFVGGGARRVTPEAAVGVDRLHCVAGGWALDAYALLEGTDSQAAAPGLVMRASRCAWLSRGHRKRLLCAEENSRPPWRRQCKLVVGGHS